MKFETFGEFIRRLREENNLPLRKVAAQLDIDTSTLSKVERGERPITKEYLRPLAGILRLKLKQIQIKFITDNVHRELGELEYVLEGLKAAERQIKKSRK